MVPKYPMGTLSSIVNFQLSSSSQLGVMAYFLLQKSKEMIGYQLELRAATELKIYKWTQGTYGVFWYQFEQNPTTFIFMP